MKRSIWQSIVAVRTGIFLLSVFFVLGSCEKVIDVDLNNAEKKFVIEGIVSDQPGIGFVNISRTKNFDDDSYWDPVSGASVKIQENGGAIYTLTDTLTPGRYEAPGFVGRSGFRYNLTVTVNGETFTAESIMPPSVDLDTIYVSDELIFTSRRKIVNAVFDDPPGLGNSFRFIQYVNGFQEIQTLIRNDDYSDGRRIVNKLFYFSEDEDEKRNIKSGDQVMIDMFCIEPAVYKYWFSLDRSAIGNGQQATPSNPVSNIKGGALGYFSAQTVQTKSMVVP
jgi:hypothetical protein